MNTETLTQKLHDKADRELRERIRNSMDPIWKELGANGDWQRGKEGPKLPWPGPSGAEFEKVAFEYLCAPNRERAVSDFMAKVESMASQMEELGLVIADNAGREAEL